MFQFLTSCKWCTVQVVDRPIMKTRTLVKSELLISLASAYLCYGPTQICSRKQILECVRKKNHPDLSISDFTRQKVLTRRQSNCPKQTHEFVSLLLPSKRILHTSITNFWSVIQLLCPFEQYWTWENMNHLKKITHKHKQFEM